MCQGHPRAYPPPGPERDQLEIRPFGVDVELQEPVGLEAVGVLPHSGVPAHGPQVDHDLGALRYLEPADLHLFVRPVREEERLVLPQGLLDDRLQVGEPWDVGLQYLSALAEDLFDLSTGLCHNLRVPQ